jgi:hypothetical protein
LLWHRALCFLRNACGACGGYSATSMSHNLPVSTGVCLGLDRGICVLLEAQHPSRCHRRASTQLHRWAATRHSLINALNNPLGSCLLADCLDQLLPDIKTRLICRFRHHMQLCKLEKVAVGEHVLSSSLSSSFLPSTVRSGAVLSCAVAAIYASCWLIATQSGMHRSTCPTETCWTRSTSSARLEALSDTKI